MSDRWWESAPKVGSNATAAAMTPTPLAERPFTDLTPEEARARMASVLPQPGERVQNQPYARPDAPLGEGYDQLLGASAVIGGVGGARAAWSALPKGARLLLGSVLKFELAKRGTRGGLKEVGVPGELADTAGEWAGVAAGGTGLAASLMERAAARGAVAAAPAVANAAVRAVGPRAVEVAAPKAATAAESLAEEMIPKILKLRTAHGMSEAQIASAVRDLYGLEPSAAKLVTKTVLASIPK